MAKLTKKQVLHVAELSNLTLTDSEIKKLTPQLDKIIDFVAKLSEVDTDGVEPTSQTTGLTNILKEDIVKSDESLSQDEALSATDDQNGYFKVPSILTNRSDD
ncbi:MAG: Asp-tRNA(Asn)/Glu-tRNA(Gln) amidotransferase subunit GatC [Patescibacteria group bacterium]